MKTISIDIETYSGTDLGKCGVYKYTEDPDFEVLLFGYAVDGGEVHVVDLALGEKIPADIAASLTDENVLKFAFNANFERVCLSRHLGMPTGEYLDPSSWRCTMVWAAYMGLPLSLQGVGTVLNLDKQKLTEGKELIKYFCSPCAPTKSNGGRTRNRPEDAPEKWTLFKSYNLRDVETEMGIQQKLTKFPVPEFVWDEYHIDQEINDRGVRLDIPLVDTAIRMDAASRQELMDDMRRITELENPNSVTQMRSWLADNGLETNTLGKKAVNEMLKTAPPELADALVLRQQLAKSSVKKYQAMQKAFGSLMYKIVEIGGNIVKGLWQGIQQLASWLWDKVSGWISSIWDGICDFFGIHSPSREMAWVGEMLVKGLAGSISDNGEEAVKAAEAMSADISDVINGLAADMQTALPSDFSVNSTVDGPVGGAMSGSISIYIDSMNVRDETDIQKIAQELYALQRKATRGKGLVMA